MRAADLFSAVVEAFFPCTCACCPNLLPGNRKGLCGVCDAALVPLGGQVCARCGRPVDDILNPCLHCSADPPPQAGTVAWGAYDSVLRQALLALKHRRHDELAAPLGRRLGSRVALEPWAERIQMITSVPSHVFHRVRRGSIAAELLAVEVARCLGGRHTRLLRRRGLRRQAGLTRRQREAMGRRPFVVRSPRRVSGRTVLVIDDVSTTGTTLSRVCATLLSSGAHEVYAASVAWAPDSRRVT